jgi:hypothetical protein
MTARPLASLAIVLALAAVAIPFPAREAAGQGFQVELLASTFYALFGGQAEVGFNLYNLDPGIEDFTVAIFGDGLAASPPSMNFSITGGGRVNGTFRVSASSAGEYPFAVVMRRGELSARAEASAVFLPPLSCKFVSPATNGRTGAVGVGQTYTGTVNFTNWGPSSLRPAFTLPARDIAGKDNARSAQPVNFDVGEIAPFSSKLFTFEGASLPDIGTRAVAPQVKIGDIEAPYGYENGTAGVFNVTAFGFTLVARELLGVELSQDRFVLGERGQATIYLECRKAGGVTGGKVIVSLRTDIQARLELSDYAAQPRFEEFEKLVGSAVDFDRGYTLPPMETGAVVLQPFGFHPKICRATDAGGSFFLDFKADLEGAHSLVSVPVSVIPPLTITMDAHEKVTYSQTGERVLRTMTVKNISNSTISGASASFFLDFKERGFLRKADIADTPSVPVPSLGPGEQTVLSLSVTPRSPGTWALFPVVEWGDGLMVYGSHVVVAASAPEPVPVGPYVTAFLVIAIPAALMRRFTPE